MFPDELSDITSSPNSWIICSAGRASMVNIGGKDVTERYALAAGTVYLGPAAYELVKENKMKKGDVLTVAQLAGASAARASCSIPVSCGLLQKQHSSCKAWPAWLRLGNAMSDPCIYVLVGRT